MIIGIGSDLVDIRRIEAMQDRFGERFLSRLFTENERRQASERRGRRQQSEAARLAKYVAAKEATAKALGAGQGMNWRDVEVTYDPSGKPRLEVYGQARAVLQRHYVKGRTHHLHLSLSDDYPYALAFVVFESMTGI